MDEQKQQELEEYQKEINDRMIFLANSDYKAIKHSEGEISDSEYEEIKTQRQKWRDEINEYQEKLAALSDSTSE